MKSFATLLVAAMLVAACSTNDSDTEPAATPPTDTAPTELSPSPEATEPDDEFDDDLDAIGDIEVDRNLLSVEVTIPPDFVDGADPDTVRAEAQEQGISEVTFNDDGSITYKMSRSQHRQMMTRLGGDISEMLDDLPDDFPSIQNVEHNRDFTHVTLTVNRNAWENSLDAFATLSIAFGAGIYQIFDGTKQDDIQIDVDIVDADTREVFDTIMLPDAWDD